MSGDFDAYAGLSEAVDDPRWAYGTGFTDPLAGVDTTLPDGVDGDVLATYCLMLADDALVFSHRLAQWVTRAPELEEETALANIALDLLGQARLLLARAATADPSLGDEDRLAFFRTTAEFRNVRLVERYDDDFAELVARLLAVTTWRLAYFELLRRSADPVLAAVADKAVRELTYHRDYAAQWVIRLGDGTDLSRHRMIAAVELTWESLDELFVAPRTPLTPPTIAPDPTAVRQAVGTVLDTVLAAARLPRPEAPPATQPSGRDGVHTPALDEMLDEMQSVARAHPDATW